MAEQLEWDKFEAALLIDAAEQVLRNPSAKKETVKNLSRALRYRAINRGIMIDNVFRNTNGISLQLTKVIFLLTDGDMGLPGASKIFANMVDLKNNKPSQFAKLLTKARKQVTNDDFEGNLKTKESFMHWLDKIPKKKISYRIHHSSLGGRLKVCIRARTLQKMFLGYFRDYSIFMCLCSVTRE